MAEKDRVAEDGSCPRCGAHKHTPRSPELKRDVTTRINRAVGH